MLIRIALSVAVVITVARTGIAADPPEAPRDLGLTERTSTRLTQIDVTVSGAKNAIQGLTAADFVVRLNDKRVPNIVVDDLCLVSPSVRSTAPLEAPAAPNLPAASKSESARPAGATYLFYFDMAHLTQSGRQGAIDSAREMLPKLLLGENRAMIIANAAELKTLVPLTSDVTTLDAALAKMIHDVSTFDIYASTEGLRMAQVVREMADDPLTALMTARRFAADERWRQENDLRRLSMVLGRFADVDAPKIAIYFADNMRQNAGEHYLSFFGETNLMQGQGVQADAEAIRVDGDTGVIPLDRVVNEAAGLGIRFYTVEGQGITGEAAPIEVGNSASIVRQGGKSNMAPPAVNSQHTRDAQGTMMSLAAETGGRAFLNGVAPARMAAQILGDLSCLYLLSFDPKEFPQDKPLAVAVVVKKPNVKTMVRGRLVIQSESVRLTGRVLSAFVSPAGGVARNDAAVRIGMIPISYDAGKFKARVQVLLGGSAVPSATWDIGTSLVSRGAVRQDGSGRIQVMLPNTPAVFEQDMEFAPGDFDLVAVAHETQTDTVLSTETHGTWPKPDADLASVGPIVASQPRAGGFLRNGEKQTQGAVVIAEDEPIRRDAPTAVISLVCRAKDEKRPLRVVRTLVGEAETPVGSSDLDLKTQRCAQVVDLVPPKVLGPGRYRFVVSVSANGQELAKGERAITVPEPPSAQDKNGS